MNVLKFAATQLGCFTVGVDHCSKDISLGTRGGSSKEGSGDGLPRRSRAERPCGQHAASHGHKIPLWPKGKELHELVLLHTYRMEYPSFMKPIWVQLALITHELTRRFRKRAQ
jgi:hypothetical protein